MRRVSAMLILINLFLVAVTSFAQPAREGTQLVQPGESRDDNIHVVSYGETLGGIAEGYGIDLYDLMRVNGLYSHVIFPGQVLELPMTTPAPDESVDEPQPGANLRKHIVQYGETLGTIAAAYGIDLKALIVENGVFGHIIYPGQALILPGVSADAAPLPASETVAVAKEPPEFAHQARYVVRPGDTLGELAQAYGITLLTLMRANDIYYPHRIYVGQQLQMPSTPALSQTVANVESFIDIKAAESSGSAPAIGSGALETAVAELVDAGEDAPVFAEPPPDHFEHTVRFRETLGAIAKHYGISVTELTSANGIVNANRIDQGQTLWIPPSAITREPPAAPAAAEADPGASAAGEREQYTVQPGEYLSQIGNKLGMHWAAIAEVNGLTNPNSLRPGMVLLVPNVEDLAKYPATYGWNRYNLYSDDPGAHIGVGREFVVVLSTQRAYAYEDGTLLKAALVSTGLPATPTVQGDYRIYRKRRSQRMTGPDYDLDNVEWVMYFYQGYAFHGAWWHNNFGQPMSHGCVNMTNADAKWFYDFGSIGTPVHVRYT